jgi:hypothetical protein
MPSTTTCSRSFIPFSYIHSIVLSLFWFDLWSAHHSMGIWIAFPPVCCILLSIRLRSILVAFLFWHISSSYVFCISFFVFFFVTPFFAHSPCDLKPHWTLFSIIHSSLFDSSHLIDRPNGASSLYTHSNNSSKFIIFFTVIVWVGTEPRALVHYYSRRVLALFHAVYCVVFALTV